MPSILEAARQIAASALPQETIEYGPWRGSMRARPIDRIPNEYVAGSPDETLNPHRSKNFRYEPDTGYFKRRGGQTIKFDTLTAGHATTGLLPGVWGASPSASSVGARWRWGEEYDGPINTDGTPSAIGLATRETLAASCLDDGKFSDLWVRDQVNNAQYTLGSEYSATTYPLPGSPQSYKFVPLWYDSGDGGITRGAGDNYNAARGEFARRFFFCGSRRFAKSGTWWYFPSFLGTPARTTIDKAGDSVGTSLPSSSLVGGGNFQDWGTNGAFGGVAWQCIETNDGATSYIRQHQDIGTFVSDFGLTNGPLSTSISVWTVTFVARYNPTLTAILAGSVLQFGIVRSNGNRKVSPDFDASTLTNAFATYTATVTFDGTGETTGNTANSVRITNVVPPGSNGDKYIEVTMISVAPAGGQVGFRSNRLIPSGPWPPTWPGRIVKGSAVAAGSDVILRPDVDVGTDGGWLGNDAGTDLFTYIDEAVLNDADYITAAFNGAAGYVSVANPAFTPSSGETVQVTVRAKKSLGGTGTLLVDFTEVTTVRATSGVITLGTGYNYTTFTLSAAQVAAVSNWTGGDLRFKFTPGGNAGTVEISIAYMTIRTAGVRDGLWLGSTRFLHALAYRFQDDSVWMPSTPRLPNATLTDGFGLFTVDSANPTVGYDKIVWTLPVPPKDVKELILLRTPGIDSALSDNLQINPYDLREVDVVTAGVTTYEDFVADDDNLLIDPGRTEFGRDGFFIRFDHRMPPRARHISAGDMKFAHSYGSWNPCAIEIAPVGRSSDYDLNLADDNATLYNQSSMYVRLTLDSAGVAALTLNKSDGTTLTTKSLALATYDTLQKLVDAINATSCAVDSQQWRAQLCPNVDEAANSTSALLPHFRTIDSCVVSGQTISKAAGGLSKVAVGAHISGTGVTRGAYISRIDSDTQLTFVGTITAATKTLNFYFELGDDPLSVGAAGTVFGYQRVIANSLPGFLFFNKTFLMAQYPVEKSVAWTTIAPPGSMKSAPNNFSIKPANTHRPPTADVGVSLGVGFVDQGIVLPYANKVGAVRNLRDTGSGLDEEYRVQIINEGRGACGPVIQGDRVCFFPTREGIVAADLYNEMLVSEEIFQHTPLLGDFSYEVPKAQAATSADTDDSYFHLRVMHGALWVSYRASGSHPNRLVEYNFSPGRRGGLESLVRDKPLLDPERERVIAPVGSLYGWSVPLVRSVTAMLEGRRTDGSHMYGFNDENGGSTGDGRIDELEVTDQDNLVDIAGEVDTPWEHDERLLSAQEITAEHASPAGSTGALVLHRSLSDDTSSLTLTTSSTLSYVRDVKMLPQKARAATHDCFIGFTQATGGAREVRKLWFRLKRLPSYK